MPQNLDIAVKIILVENQILYIIIANRPSSVILLDASNCRQATKDLNTATTISLSYLLELEDRQFGKVFASSINKNCCEETKFSTHFFTIIN